MTGNSGYERIYAAVKRIPRSRVATYGQVAELAGLPRQPRRVGYALSALQDSAGVPWHRVVNAQGRISARSHPGFEEVQRLLLEREGVVFDGEGRISLARFLWRPRTTAARRGTRPPRAAARR
jgi:methylated-DNA-protein-cysteine methyltransferase-like protein